MIEHIWTSAKVVSGMSSSVKINRGAIRKFCAQFDSSKASHWLASSPFSIRELDANDRLAYLFVYSAVCFSYWGDPKWKVDYKGKEYDGSHAMLAAIGKSVEKSGEMLNPKHLSRLKRKEAEKLFEGNIEIPMLGERWQNLRELGYVILKEFEGKFRNVVEFSGNEASGIVETMKMHFPSYRESYGYVGKVIGFFKRAQLLAADIANSFPEEPLLWIKHPEVLTACADYKLPQVLRRHGVLEYSGELAQLVDSKAELKSGSAYEVEIRASTIQAVELMKLELPYTANQINDYLWLEGQEKHKDDKPYHRTRTTAY
ncbi:putative Queuosine, Q, salvage protein family [uncultured archaeon]|nr:putative Queuosine, Q, salvage protein family [uncultured archaeon]